MTVKRASCRDCSEPITSDGDGITWAHDDPPATDHAPIPGVAHHARLVAGEQVEVLARCPHCDAAASIVARVTVRLTRDQDGDGALALRMKATKLPHLCGQLALPLEVDADVVSIGRARRR